MKRILAALGFVLFGTGLAHAQSTVRVQAQGIATCGTQSLSAGVFYPITQDLTGTLCTLGGAGGTVTANQGTAGTNAQAWWVRIGDGTNGPSAVKPGSTTAQATDAALVTQLNPNSPGIIANAPPGTPNTTTVLTVQGAPSMTKILVTPDSVALPANQSVNTAQVNGVTTLTGTGVAGTGSQRVTLSNTDPCMSPDIAKSSAVISVTSATTTSLVAVSGSTTVYVCGFSMTIAPSATSADTALFEYGTGAACTSPTTLTGTFGNGDLTSAAPVTNVRYGPGSTVFKSAASAGVCILTAGTAVNVQGVITFVQQ